MKFLLLDGNSFCYRAFYAIRDLRTSRGEPTNALYGFISILERLLKELKPDGVALAFDTKAPTFRHKRYEEYKIQRPPMPEDLVRQMPWIKEWVLASNIPVFEKEGFEADDVLAMLSRLLERQGHEVFVVTGDKDMLQLVNKKVKVLNPQKDNFIYDENAVRRRFGVDPKRVVDVLALMGDASDNIPGVPGIGEKTATKLIAAFGSLEGVIQNRAKVAGDKIRENLEKYEAQAALSKELATLETQVPLEADLSTLRRRAPDSQKLTEFYRRFEFRHLLKNLTQASASLNTGDARLQYTLIEDRGAFKKLKARLADEKQWAFDFETTGVDAMTAEPLGISFCFEEKKAVFVSFRGALKASDCLEDLKELFENPALHKIGQNLKYEAMILGRRGIVLEGISFDTMIASYVLNPAKPNHNLDDIALEHLGVRITSIKELIGTGRGAIAMADVPLDRLYPYGCQDSDVTFRLAAVLRKKLEEKNQWELFRDIEMPLVRILSDMEMAGVAIDTRLLAEFSKEMEKSLATLTRRIHKEAGEAFNIQSPKQLSEILFEKLGLPMVKKTKTGTSTDVEVLLELSELHPLPGEILKFRELAKLKNTYVDALPKLICPRTHRVHTSFNQTVTATGRLSSSDPNLQNIPVRTEEGRKIRRAFVAGPKKVLISADYSQIELRVLAHLSEDPALLKAFHSGADVHRYTASLIFNVPLDRVEDSMRESAKTVNFGVLYGMGPFSLAKTLDITHASAKDFIKAYFERYPRVKQYLEETTEGARRQGYVSTFFNRRRYMPDILSNNPRIRSFAERTATNAPIQGTASDVIKIAMLRVHEQIRKKRLASRMLLQVHDELLFESPVWERDEMASLAESQMRQAVSFRVPLAVSVKAGPNWLDMEDVS